jgi:hypothetical protein
MKDLPTGDMVIIARKTDQNIRETSLETKRTIQEIRVTNTVARETSLVVRALQEIRRTSLVVRVILQVIRKTGQVVRATVQAIRKISQVIDMAIRIVTMIMTVVSRTDVTIRHDAITNVSLIRIWADLAEAVVWIRIVDTIGQEVTVAVSKAAAMSRWEVTTVETAEIMALTVETGGIFKVVESRTGDRADNLVITAANLDHRDMVMREDHLATEMKEVHRGMEMKAILQETNMSLAVTEMKAVREINGMNPMNQMKTTIVATGIAA